MQKTICELFAGVGGFRLGFESLNNGWETVWFSQWEPKKKKQDAFQCYVLHFGDSADLNGEYRTNEDIAIVDKYVIPDHTLLVGGFPCQDYSVAKPLPFSKGIEGKKGVLWWSIYDIIKAKRPPFCLFENVDRLLKSPFGQRGRDFGVMLSCLYSLGYSAEWRVIDASLYGNAQRRKRVYIFTFRNDTKYRQQYKKECGHFSPLKMSVFSGFPVEKVQTLESCFLTADPYETSERFLYGFGRGGCMVDGQVISYDFEEKSEEMVPLSAVLEQNVDEKYFALPESISRWEYFKSAKRVERTSKSGYHYCFSEGAVPFPDPIDRPARTILTSEGTIGRSSHIIMDPSTGRLRILTPVETERLDGFPDGWTGGMSDHMRYFCMGNALVVPVIVRIAKKINEIVESE